MKGPLEAWVFFLSKSMMFPYNSSNIRTEKLVFGAKLRTQQSPDLACGRPPDDSICKEMAVKCVALFITAYV